MCVQKAFNRKDRSDQLVTGFRPSAQDFEQDGTGFLCELCEPLANFAVKSF